MTSLEAGNLLFEWYSNKDVFEIEKDFKQIVPVSEDEEKDKAAMIASLDDFTEKQLVNKVKLNDKDFWVLSKPYSAYSQNVELSVHTATALAGIINTFCDLLENPTDKCDPTAITEKEIQNLLFICNNLFSQINESRPDVSENGD